APPSEFLDDTVSPLPPPPPLIAAIEHSFDAFQHACIARWSTSKRSASSRVASAAQRDEKEVQLQQAAAELDNRQHASICKAAAAHGVPASTLRYWKVGQPPKAAAQNGQQTLTPATETALVDLIWRCAISGYPLTPAHLMEYANAAAHPASARSQPIQVTHSWMQSFLIRHPSIRSHWSRCLNNQRLTGTTEDVIRQWYVSLGEIMRNFGIASANVFNMDETSFMFGQAGSEQVLVPSGDPASWFKAQPGTRESATVIECIGSSGQVLPPLIITKGVHHTVGEQRRMAGIPSTWHFMKSSNGWTNNKLTVEWLKTIFDPSTRPSTRSEYRLLIIDGHGSHMMTAFCNTAWSRQIIPLVLLAHTTHVMQPLNVSIFGLLTGSYRRLVAEVAEHMDGIDKAQFGSFYAQAREKVLTQARAQKAFSDSGISLDPSLEKVLRCLASGSIAANTSTPQHQPLQEIAGPCLASAFNTTLNIALNTHAQEPGSRDARALKKTIQQANEEAQASIAVLEAKDPIITREEAERALAEKEGSTLRNGAGNCQEEKEEVIAPASAAAPDGDDTSEDGDKGLLASPMTPSPPTMRSSLDELDDGEPLSAIDDDNDHPFGFFETLPQPGPSRIKH
ncbi:related to transposase (C-terminal fragment), partial [Sporisorium reilianum SRZ2]